MKITKNQSLFILVITLLLTIQYFPLFQVRHESKVSLPPRQAAEFSVDAIDKKTALKIWYSDVKIGDDIFAVTAYQAAQIDDESRKKIDETNKTCKQSLDLLRAERESRISAQNKADQRQLELEAKTRDAQSKEDIIFGISLFGLLVVGAFRVFLPDEESRSWLWKKTEKPMQLFELITAIAVLAVNKFF